MNYRKNLFRNPKQGKISGVCAGIAEYFNIETWLVRILTVTAFLLTTGPFIFVGYVLLWAILDKKPEDYEYNQYNEENASNPKSPSDAKYKGYVNPNSDKVSVKDTVWRAGQAPREAFKQVQQKFIRAENRLRKIESYVTSNEFQLNREIKKL
ncbi:envelope stress response membrane protein PspC [Glaciecola sp. 1036]|uniref:envelope stress response membrane protein PspC n=1 Tax=Alteromonadaceae TaxID=72275 RepID=UPI003D04A5E0